MENSKHCFIIDDDLDDQEIFMMCVTKIGAHITCTCANNGVEAITLLETNSGYSPEYIFIDMNMPKMNGIETLRMIKQMDRLKLSKIFMYSTTSEKAIVKEVKNMGADDFIVKPSKTLELKEKLARIFGIVSEIDPKIKS
jgi:CheY-like chemotaxis protein